ncbi:MAG TPA: hypothetical protein PKE25_14750, partial [Novosphingobium sp.]|nr:hypothetical protein [Novosphingobium sp.]
VAGACSATGIRPGVPGVRVMLEDGSFAVTDADGRYPFEGVTPGTHVVQAAAATLPAGSAFVDCTRSARSAGNASSRFVTGQGGSLVVADFHASLPAEALLALQASTAGAAEAPADKTSPRAPGEAAKPASEAIDWLALGDGPDGWLTPARGRAPSSMSMASRSIR